MNLTKQIRYYERDKCTKHNEGVYDNECVFCGNTGFTRGREITEFIEESNLIFPGFFEFLTLRYPNLVEVVEQ